ALCASPDPDPWPVDAAAGAMQNAGQTPDAIQIFKRALRTGCGNPQLAAAVIRLMLGQRSFVRAIRLFLRLQAGEAQRRAAAPLVHGLAEANCRNLIRWVLWRRRDVLFADDAAWGQVGYALSHFKRMKEVARWLSDWPRRTQVQPWMLFNYCLALRHLGRYDDATQVARHVLQSWGHREGSADLRLFV